MRIVLFALLLAAVAIMPATAATYPPPQSGTYIIPLFTFGDGESLKNLRLHYETLGTPRVDASGNTTNAVLIIHGTGGSAQQFINDRFAGVLSTPGGILDVSKYFIILPDEIGYHDMVRATHQLLVDGLHVNHLRLVMGTSMSGMQTWMWGEMYPTMMDALMPLASLLKGAADLLWVFGSAPLYDQSLMPTQQSADAYYGDTIALLTTPYEANDLLYQITASSDYDPEPQLGSIVAPLLTSCCPLLLKRVVMERTRCPPYGAIISQRS